MTMLMEYGATTSYSNSLKNALPLAGVDGTLKDRMCGTPAANDARAKTGTMTGVCTLAGYVTTQGGEHLVFAIFLNGYQGNSSKSRALQDSIVEYLAGIQ
jgi:D-alanyl-D-alanine carboxypeptidase